MQRSSPAIPNPASTKINTVVPVTFHFYHRAAKDP